MSPETLGTLVLAAVVLVAVLIWVRARRGYRNIAALMARVDAAASAEATASSNAANHVHVAVGTTSDGESIYLSAYEREVVQSLRRGAIDTGPDWDARADKFLRGDRRLALHYDDNYDYDDRTAAADDDRTAGDDDDRIAAGVERSGTAVVRPGDNEFDSAEHSLAKLRSFVRDTGGESGVGGVVSRGSGVRAGSDRRVVNGRTVNL